MGKGRKVCINVQRVPWSNLVQHSNPTVYASGVPGTTQRDPAGMDVAHAMSRVARHCTKMHAVPTCCFCLCCHRHAWVRRGMRDETLNLRHGIMLRRLVLNHITRVLRRCNKESRTSCHPNRASHVQKVPPCQAWLQAHVPSTCAWIQGCEKQRCALSSREGFWTPTRFPRPASRSATPYHFNLALSV